MWLFKKKDKNESKEKKDEDVKKGKIYGDPFVELE